MPPQTHECRISNTEKRVTELEKLPGRIDNLTLQVLQFQTETRGEFSAVRGEVQQLGENLRGEMRETADTLRGEMRQLNAATLQQMRVLHEDVIARIGLVQEGTNRKRRTRKH